jgi:hypothetical protein
MAVRRSRKIEPLPDPANSQAGMADGSMTQRKLKKRVTLEKSPQERHSEAQTGKRKRWMAMIMVERPPHVSILQAKVRKPRPMDLWTVVGMAQYWRKLTPAPEGHGHGRVCVGVLVPPWNASAKALEKRPRRPAAIGTFHSRAVESE